MRMPRGWPDALLTSWRVTIIHFASVTMSLATASSSPFLTSPTTMKASPTVSILCMPYFWTRASKQLHRWCMMSTKSLTESFSAMAVKPTKSLNRMHPSWVVAALATALEFLSFTIDTTSSCAYCLGSMSHKSLDMCSLHSTACCLDAQSLRLVDSDLTRCHRTKHSRPSTMAIKVSRAQITTTFCDRFASTALAAINGSEVKMASLMSSLAQAS
mmetsp:Transcript_19503/g.48878  ORF Transcript_19503/g.48878 Transcript_19503/m.48878 type:complete len:215 (+) Transcript_19503:198-842(+)